MVARQISGARLRGKAMRLVLPLFLVLALLTPRPAQPGAGFETAAQAPIHFDRPADSALFILRAAASLRQGDGERKQDSGAPPAVLRAPASPSFLRPRLSPAGWKSSCRVRAPRNAYRPRAPPFHAAA